MRAISCGDILSEARFPMNTLQFGGNAENCKDESQFKTFLELRSR
jgi:hypothetical protein